MGHLVSYTFDNIRIPSSEVASALAAIHALYQPETIKRLGTGTTYDRTTHTSKKCYRGTCALGLVRMNYPLVMVELGDLLADPEPKARIDAARAIATLHHPDALQFLLSLIAEGRPQDAKDAIKAMSAYAQDKTVWQQVCQTVQEREDVSLQPTLEKIANSLPA